MTAHILAGCLWVGGLVVLALVLPGLERRDVLDDARPLRPPRDGRRGRGRRHRALRRRTPGRESRCAALDDLRRVARSPSSHRSPPPAPSACSDSSPCVAMRPSMRLLRAEAVAAVGMLVAASLLLSSAPARGPQFAPIAATDRRYHPGERQRRRPARRRLRVAQSTRPELRHDERPRHPAPAAGTGASSDDHVLARRPARQPSRRPG